MRLAWHPVAVDREHVHPAASVRAGALIIDALDPERLAAFWCGLLDT